jgi:photosystem II stability/assembly factor-like uncharacterized protein
MPRLDHRRFIFVFFLLLLPACGSGGGDRHRVATPSATASVSTPTPTVTAAAAVAWAAGANSLIRSNDGGFQWAPTGRGASAVSFGDREAGWIASGYIMRTTDGGQTWVDQSPNIVDPPPVVFDIAALDRSHATAVGIEDRRVAPVTRRPAALHTEDGGATWRHAELPPLGAGADDVALLATCLAPSGAGLAAGTDPGLSDAPKTLVLLTSDAGRSWADVTDRLPHRPFAQVGCGPDGRLWFIGQSSTILMSEDGGATWQDRHGDLPAGLNVRRGAFLGGDVGWIAATEPPIESRLLVFLTRDGGQTWVQSVVAPGPGDFEAIGIDAIDATHAVVVAQDARPLVINARSSFGRSWVTVDGGASWTATEHPEPVDALWDVVLLP